MTAEVAILRAYAAASQGKYAEAEHLLSTVPEALEIPAGMDLLARIKFEQGSESTARHIWETLLAMDPANESARNALLAIDSPPDLVATHDAGCGSHRRFKYVCAIVIAAISGVAFSIGKMCGGKLQTVPTAAMASPIAIAEQSISVDEINCGSLRSLKDGILANMTASTTLVLKGGRGKHITDRQKQLSIIAECIQIETGIPLSQILFQASEEDSDSVTLYVRQ